MAKNLVIVESPAKAKTIEGFLGKDFKVLSSFGHIRDLSHKDMGVDVSGGFIPNYEVSTDKKETVKALKKEVKSSEVVWLATDEDREGEAIAWHLAETLDLHNKETKRIVFHEITKSAITKAVENPREIDYNLVNAQQARRVLDRLVGFELSPILWRKVKQGLSAGRVQSVAVRLLVEREREINSFESKVYYKVVGQFINKEGRSFKAEINSRLDTLEEAQSFLQKCIDARFSIANLEKKSAAKSPAAPFTTSTLQQEAARKLGFSVSQTMTVAQRLYEAGFITYMRTDSVNLSNDAMSSIKKEIEKEYGESYSNPRSYSTKSKGAQEAHEAIRPTYVENRNVSDDSGQQKLYDLIWKRAIASQMSNAKLERTTVTIDSSNHEKNFIAKGEVIIFDGFLKVYLEGTDEDGDEEQDGILPRLDVGENIDYKRISSRERFTKAPARFTEASLVKKLEELGIGRPSTYAPTISTVQRRGYVEKGDDEGKLRSYHLVELSNAEVNTHVLKEKAGSNKGKLCPSDIGMVVNDFLVSNFNSILDFHFTANVEAEFDQIASGDKAWNDMLNNFYGDFHAKVEDVKENSERAVGERILGVDPKTGLSLLVRIGRYGPMAQLGSQSEVEKPKFASLRKGQSIESITLNEVIDLFKLPRQVGQFEDKLVTVAVGRFGPYVRHDGKFVSLGEYDPMSIELDACIELILAKRKSDAEKHIHTFDIDEPTIQVLQGRWGPYIKMGKKNYKIPKDIDVEGLNRDKCVYIIENQPKKKKVKAKLKTKSKKK
ncbi:MAG: DNA topoisomerase I [Bacteroidetes bacterium MED-G21]|nr:MAG: DNA topoisomerase I [Bacteroidetes bacterium MED-G21]